jgi:uracil-DNA glycosylase family 4
LSEGRTRIVNGDGPADAAIMLVGEAPGAQEDDSGKPFVGRAGKFLESVLVSNGVNRESIFITNVVKCRPPCNRRPDDGEIKSCMPYLVEELRKVKPKIVVALGFVAIKAITGSSEKLGGIIGREIDVVLNGMELRVVPCYHPSAAMRNRKMRRKFEDAMRKAISLSRA